MTEPQDSASGEPPNPTAGVAWVVSPSAQEQTKDSSVPDGARHASSVPAMSGGPKGESYERLCALDVTVNVIGNAIPGIHGLQHITTDAKGFRVTPPIDYGTKRGLRIFAIGGSTTEQIYLDDKATWTYLLQTKLARALGRPVEVINAWGVRSTGRAPRQHARPHRSI